jgi:hypothetical protein
MIEKLQALWNNPAFLIVALVAALTYIGVNIMLAASIVRGQKDNIAEVSNRDQKAMDELHKLVEGLEKKEK